MPLGNLGLGAPSFAIVNRRMESDSSTEAARLTTRLRAKAITATFGQTTDRRDYASMPARIHEEPTKRGPRKQLIGVWFHAGSTTGAPLDTREARA